MCAILTWGLLWLPAARSTARHSAKMKMKKMKLVIQRYDPRRAQYGDLLNTSFLTFWENQSGGRPDSEKGLMALLTDTLEDRQFQE